MRVVDVNSDLGEGFGIWTLGDDDALLDVVTSANVACGFHGGDPSIMRRVCAKAVESGVVIGAQVGYRDLPGFGRRRIEMEPNELTNDVLYQLGALEAFARVSGGEVAYVKPHGALYSTLVTDEAQSLAVADAVRRYDPTLPVLGLPGSRWLQVAADAGLVTVFEAFADRAYAPDGSLVSRRQAGSVLHDIDAVAARCVRMAVDGAVEAVDGSVLSVAPRSICVHGDTPGAVHMARRVRAALDDAGVAVQAFVDPPRG